MKKSQNKLNILILDGDRKNTLGIIRNFGYSKKYNISVVSYSKNSICFFSKFTNKKIILVNPKIDKVKYSEELIEVLKKTKYDVLIPVSYITFQICSEQIEAIRKYTHLSITSNENVLLAANKYKTYQIADKIGMLYPKTFDIKDINEVENLIVNYPCVIKARFEAGKNIVEYANDKFDLKEKYKKICINNNIQKNELPLIQEYINGDGYGFFAIYQKGICKQIFMHKRIREYPVTGGSSVCAKSFYDEKLMECGKKLLDYLKWEGVAMVEFKQDKITGEYYLMEINAKFWGSLELALVSDVNFPELLIKSSLGYNLDYSEKFKTKKFQWLLNGEFFNLIERPRNIFKIISDLFISKNDFYFTDIFPNLYQIAYIPIYYYKKWKRE